MTKTNAQLTPATMITTRDNEQVPAGSALTLNWEGVLARKLSVSRGPMQEVIQCLLNDLRDNPTIHAVANEETEHAKKINSVLANIKVRRTPAPALWVPYLEAMANWQSRQSSAAKPDSPKATTAEDAQAAAVKAAIDRANAKIEREKKQAEAEKQAAAQLAALSPAAVLHAKARADRQAEMDRLTDIIRPYALGQACVNTNSRPTGLVLDAEHGVGISFAQDIAASIPDGCEPAKTIVPCAFCGKEHTLGDNFSFTLKRDGEEKQVTVFRAQLLWLAAKTEDGSADYVYKGGEKDGQAKKLPVLVCNECAKIARDIGKAEDLPYTVMPNYGSALDLVVRAHVKAQAEKQAERGTRATLVAKFGEVAGKSGKSDRRTHRDSAEE